MLHQGKYIVLWTFLHGIFSWTYYFVCSAYVTYATIFFFVRGFQFLIEMTQVSLIPSLLLMMSLLSRDAHHMSSPHGKAWSPKSIWLKQGQTTYLSRNIDMLISNLKVKTTYVTDVTLYLSLDEQYSLQKYFLNPRSLFPPLM